MTKKDSIWCPIPSIPKSSMSLWHYTDFLYLPPSTQTKSPLHRVLQCRIVPWGGPEPGPLLFNYTLLYTIHSFCSNAGWGHVFCFCYPSSSRQWRGRGLKTLCELTVEDWGLGMNPASCPGLAPAQPPPPILRHTPIFSSGPVVQLCPPPNFTTAQHTKTGAHNTLSISINSVLL